MSQVIVKDYINPKNDPLNFTNHGIGMWEDAEIGYPLPMKYGKFYFSYITDDQRKSIEKHFGFELESATATEFFTDYEIKLKQGVNPIDLKSGDGLLNYLALKELKVVGSLEEAQNPMNRFRFVFANDQEELEQKVTRKETIARAKSKLLDLKDNTPQRLISIAKYILPINAGIGRNANLAFDKLDTYIDNELEHKSNSADNAKYFLKTLEVDSELVAVAVDVKEALVRNFIRKQEDNWYINPASGTKYGKNEQEIIDFLMNPQNQDELGVNSTKDKEYSIRAQLKRAY